MQLPKPHILLSFAQSLDGFIARDDRTSSFSSVEDFEEVHKIRASVDAILVGRGTVEVDDPRLTARPGGKNSTKQPIRIVLDSLARIPLSSRVLSNESQTLVVVSDTAPPERVEELRKKCSVIICGQNKVDLPLLMRQLSKMGIASLMVEGGGDILTSFLNAKLVDSLRISTAPEIAGKGIRAISLAEVLSLHFLTKSTEVIGNNIVNNLELIK